VNAWDYTDPVSEAQSDLLQIDMGTKTHQMVISERGRDAEMILRQRREWQDQTSELSQAHSTMTRDPKPQATEQTAPAPAAPAPAADAVKAYARAFRDLLQDEHEHATADATE
jgi:capsid protein